MKILYVDGGGTKTAVYLVENNKIIKKELYNQSNVNTNYDESIKTIYKIIEDHKNNFDKAMFGLAGSEYVKDKIDIILKDLKTKTNREIEIFNDVEMFAILCSRKFNIDFTLLNLGTGTACVNFKNNSFKSLLGWGRVVGDIGSGYYIGINFLKFLTMCEDTENHVDIYKKFLQDFELKSIRDYISLINDVKNVTKVTNWISKQDDNTIDNFIIPCIKEVLDYISFLKTENFIFTGSVLLKNNHVKEFLDKYLPNSSKRFIDFEHLIQY
ncbi:BadF/BadG/BcrA/BcrD ATPase family protein [Malacoplasma iowae]|uniref:ATPase BadF/BadG/BcrA/BcrD type domain-containing protein n=1 Tax=Malacoplasma iowae 695 TaxID=1048830 RepID=A0A6P1LMT5_MALIO|nr:BadF/BadG/BcrA/BcrD ATPase family protein [Malacoplasma iowae]VEU61586.1 pantothenate kinase [Mycoplasmopsis fermentans]EGZ31324.1 BadF/BadG/BcrA/BcrD ATPase family protein [Malacoplasma iowae 695]QHG89322.1 hypothetical protein EER00_00170 [Malacoplasma iowae 695]QHG90253.1 hypothetical protein EER00_05250 [Malacoplasma iowae 695]WPL35977.1 hypothetical protein QX180_00955 [Malacoplasma iowae]